MYVFLGYTLLLDLSLQIMPIQTHVHAPFTPAILFLIFTGFYSFTCGVLINSSFFFWVWNLKKKKPKRKKILREYILKRSLWWV